MQLIIYVVYAFKIIASGTHTYILTHTDIQIYIHMFNGFFGDFLSKYVLISIGLCPLN